MEVDGQTIAEVEIRIAESVKAKIKNENLSIKVSLQEPRCSSNVA